MVAEKICGWLGKKSFLRYEEEIKIELSQNPDVLKWKDEKYLNFNLLHWFVKVVQSANDDAYDLKAHNHHENKDRTSILRFLFETNTVYLSIVIKYNNVIAISRLIIMSRFKLTYILLQSAELRNAAVSALHNHNSQGETPMHYVRLINIESI